MRCEAWLVVLVVAATGCPSDGGTADASSSTGSSSSTAANPSATDPDSDGGPVGDATATDGNASTGSVDDTGTGTTGAGTGTGTGAGQQCDGGNACVAIAPPDWIGPVNVGDVPFGDDLSECGGNYPELIDEFSANFVAPEAVCNCECDVPDKAACVGVLEAFNAAGCAGAATSSTAFLFSNCNNIDLNTSEYWNLDAGVIGSDCTPNFDPPMLPPAAAARDVRICGLDRPATSAGCDEGEVCIPPPTSPLPPDLCIYREGEHECPAGPYAEASVLFRGVEEGRDCFPACECGDVTGTCTGATATLWRDSNNCTSGGFCTNPPCTDALVQGCQSVSVSSVESVQLTNNPVLSNESCPSIGYEPVGDVAQTDPITVCCQAR